MTWNRRFLTSFVLTAAAGVCFSSLGCGDQGKTTTKETTIKSTESTGKNANGKHDAPKKPKEAGSSEVPGGGVETPK